MEISNYIKDVINNIYEHELYLTKFLSKREQEELLFVCGNKFKVNLFGGYEDAIKKRALITIDDNRSVKNKCVCLKVSYNNKFYNLKHSTIKWYFLNMGIDERLFGDIFSFGKDFIVIVALEIYEFIINEVSVINKKTVIIEVVENFKVDKTKNVDRAYCSSLRLDNVVSKLFCINRNKAKNIIKHDKLYLNGEIKNKYTCAIVIGDNINIRGMGKAIINEIDISNRSGKYIIKYYKYM
ncbi:MAG: YlmH/Sll1252 family protein [Bacilli bacterium]